MLKGRRVVVAVFIERSKHGADRRLGMWCAVLDDTQMDDKLTKV
jgi:hypothetical protein